MLEDQSVGYCSHSNEKKIAVWGSMVVVEVARGE